MTTEEDDGEGRRSLQAEMAVGVATTRPGRPAATQSRAGRTVLPGPLATAVSLASRSTSLVIRMGTVIGGYGFEAARFTTLSSLELGRGLLENILLQAGKDMAATSRSDLSRSEAESVLERSLEHLHRSMTSVVFWTTTGFRVTGAAVSAVSEVSRLLVASLDQFFGSTDSSRAIASIIILIRREFQNPATGVQGERVGVVDLVLGLCGLAFLQASCGRLIEEDLRRHKVEETVWDLVLLDDGEPVDVPSQISSRAGTGELVTRQTAAAVLDNHGFRTSTMDSNEDEGPDESRLEIDLRQQILRSLPPNAAGVSITTAVSTSKMVTVDITGAEPPPPLPPPPGVEIVEERRIDGIVPSYRIVYRVDRESLSTTLLQPASDNAQRVEPADDIGSYGDDAVIMADTDATTAEFRPSVPPKSHVVPANGTAGPSTSNGDDDSNKPNQKRPRQPLALSSSGNSSRAVMRKQPVDRRPPNKDNPVGVASKKPSTEKRGGLRSALKRNRGTGLSGLLQKDASGSEIEEAGLSTQRTRDGPKPSARGADKGAAPRISVPPTAMKRREASDRNSSLLPRRTAPLAPPLPPRMPGGGGNRVENGSRPSSRASYVSVSETRRDLMVAQKDDFDRPLSPLLMRTEVRSSGLVKSRSERDMSEQLAAAAGPSAPSHHHRRSRSQVYTPSIYTLDTNASQTSLVLSPLHFQHAHRGMFGDEDALAALRRTGKVNGLFPDFPLIRNVTRYMRFSSASYGSSFLRVLGMSKPPPFLGTADDTHQELRWFAHHTGSDASSILLSSFVDAQGGSDGSGATNTGVPLVHYISLDHESRAVVLACRGTLGFEDVLADMACDYDELQWRGRCFRVHKGVHASARRLLYGGDGRVLLTLRQALDEFSGYGLVLCGHSLGGAVTALLGVMLAEPAPVGSAFVTSGQPAERRGSEEPIAIPPEHLCLPAGRPIHVYAYGPPATMSASLRQATRGLITSVVQGNDLVPCLSLGVLHDLQAVALAFKADNHAAKAEVRQRLWQALQTGVAGQWYSSSSNGPARNHAAAAAEEDDQWAYAALKTLRASMISDKLLPPGEVFAIESRRVLRRDAFAREADGHWALPARRVVLKYVRDVEARFREVRFGTSMLTDHSPAKYEDALSRLEAGVAGSGFLS